MLSQGLGSRLWDLSNSVWVVCKDSKEEAASFCLSFPPPLKWQRREIQNT